MRVPTDGEADDLLEGHFAFDAVGDDGGGRCDVVDVAAGDEQEALLTLVDVVDLDDGA